MKSIVFVIGSLNTGGAEKVLLNYINYFYRRLNHRYNVELFLISHEGDLLASLDSGIKIAYLYKGNKSIEHYSLVGKCLYKIKRRIKKGIFFKFPSLFSFAFPKFRKFEYGFIFVQDLYWFSDTEFGKKKYLWIQNNLNLIKDSEKYRDGTFARKFNKLIAISDGIKNDLLNNIGIDRDQVFKCNNPIDIDSLALQARKPLPQLGSFNYLMPYLVTMGRLVHQKGFDILVETLSLLRFNGYKVNLVIIGGGEKETELKTLIDTYNLIYEEDVIITGTLSNPYPIIKQSKIFVCSSRFDGLSTSINEALALGIPVVSTPCDFGPKEILRNGDFGLLSKKIEAHSLFSKIKQLLDDDMLHAKYSELSIRRAKDFSIQSISKQIEETL